MEPEKNRALPFITRDMLSFGDGVVFNLKCVVVTSSTSPIYIRGLTKSAPFTYTIVPAGAQGVEIFRFGLNDIPLWLSVTAGDTGDTLSEGFITVRLEVNGDESVVLTQGTLNAQVALSWPNAQPLGYLEQQGDLVGAAQGNPAAGSEIAFGPAGNEYWKLKYIKFRLVTSATVANRHVVLRIQDEGAVAVARFPAGASQQASETIDYYFNVGSGLAEVLANQIITGHIAPDTLVVQNGGIGTNTLNIQAGDQFSATEVCYAKFYKS